MKSFLIKILYFISLIIIPILVISCFDVFKIFYEYESYYKDNVITLNRELVCTKTFNKYQVAEKFNSFILGSSRSQAFKCQEWNKYLDENSKPFHFDASGDGIYGVSKKVQYIDEMGLTIDNSLIIVDRAFLRGTKNRDGHLFISPTELSKESDITFYAAFIKAQLNLKFLIAYLDYSIFNTHRSYMGHLIRKSEFPNKSNDINCDIWYGYDKDIEKDSLTYYDKLIKRGVFERPKKTSSKCEITELEIEQLKTVKEIFNKQGTNYKIVISPIYDQVPLERDQVQLLNEIFGEENIYNFSGENRFTEPISNYYESSHYRPHVADEIFKIIYSN